MCACDRGNGRITISHSEKGMKQIQIATQTGLLPCQHHEDTPLIVMVLESRLYYSWTL